MYGYVDDEPQIYKQKERMYPDSVIAECESIIKGFDVNTMTLDSLFGVVNKQPVRCSKFSVSHTELIQEVIKEYCYRPKDSNESWVDINKVINYFEGDENNWTNGHPILAMVLLNVDVWYVPADNKVMVNLKLKKKYVQRKNSR